MKISRGGMSIGFILVLIRSAFAAALGGQRGIRLKTLIKE